jgi:creatinine amidohydrolase
MNGHYENVAFITEAIDLFMRDSPDSKVLLVGWWEQVSDELIEEVFAGAGFPGWDTEHAGITETSLMQLFAPELVREDKIIDDQSERKPTYDIYPTPDDIIPNSGVLYKATFASQEKGEKVAKHVTERIIQIVHDELGSS